MTRAVAELLDRIENHSIFSTYPIYFSGGTALSTYLDHRVSYDLDFVCSERLPVQAIKAFGFEIGARIIPDPTRATAFRINRGENLENFHIMFMMGEVKMEFSYFDDPMITAALSQSEPRAYRPGASLRILSLHDIASLKSIALFRRQKSRDLFDIAILLEEGVLNMDDLENTYNYLNTSDKDLLEYIRGFSAEQGDADDSTLDFLSEHRHYKTFARLGQKERFNQCKAMFLEQFERSEAKKYEEKRREVRKF